MFLLIISLNKNVCCKLLEKEGERENRERERERDTHTEDTEFLNKTTFYILILCKLCVLLYMINKKENWFWFRGIKISD